MPGPTDETLFDLDVTERGFVLGALLVHVAGTGDPTPALEPPSDVRCAEALARIGALPRTDRVRLTGQLAREVVAPIPSGIDALDATFVDDLLRDEPVEIARLVARTAPPRLRQAAAARGLASEAAAPGSPPNADESVESNAPSEMIAELQRAVFAPIVAMMPEPVDLFARVAERGARVLGTSLRGAGGDVALRAAAVVGPPWAERVLAAAREQVRDAAPGEADAAAEGPAEAALDRADAAQLVASTRPGVDPRDTVARIGARATGLQLVRTGSRGLGGADQARALAQRLPAALGAELLAAAGLDRRPPRLP